MRRPRRDECGDTSAGYLALPDVRSGDLRRSHHRRGGFLMVMSLHKLTAGDGYEYLTRQVAAMDSTERGNSSLADYYSAKGESPGHWTGSGLAALGAGRPAWAGKSVLWTVEAGSEVTAEQMLALFGEGLHPNAE